MIYATLDDLIARFGQQELVEQTDLVNMPPQAVDAARVALALADASALVDGYVGQVWRLPLLGCLKPDQTRVPPPQLVALCCDLARADLFRYLPDEHDAAKRRKLAIKALEAIADGKATVACPWGGEPGEVLGRTAQTEPGLSYSFSRRSVTDDDLRGF